MGQALKLKQANVIISWARAEIHLIYMTELDPSILCVALSM